MLKENKGITLVALVITIIVLLILAGVTISMVLGDNGILGKAQGAQEAQEKAYASEIVGLSLKSIQMEEMMNATAFPSPEAKQNALIIAIGQAGVFTAGTTTEVIEYKSGNNTMYTVTVNYTNYSVVGEAVKK